ncbi:MAG: response regulator [Vicinamibacteria bacterium]|nr:response regulator [Vicinamibacteria bacterium]
MKTGPENSPEPTALVNNEAPPGENGIAMATCKRVLVVDDDPVSLTVIKAVLEDLGYDVSTRQRALGTSAVIADERPDVVLVDVSMPGLTGDGVVLLGKTNPAFDDVIFILYSGSRGADLEALVNKTGAAGGIVKTGNLAAFAREFQRIAGPPPARNEK